MLSFILAISLFLVTSDTIDIKSAQDISYRLFSQDSTLYFQYRADKNWSALKIIDEKVSEYDMVVTSGDYLHIVWIKHGSVYYKMNMYPVSKDSFRKDRTPRWECNITISEPELTEPASNISINSEREYLYANWQVPLENTPSQIETWQRKRWFVDTPFLWQTPENISPNIIPISDINHSLHNRDLLYMKRMLTLQSGLYTGAGGKVICRDSNHDDRNEIIFHTGTIYSSNPLRWEVWQCHPINCYELVFADTGIYPNPPGITSGNLIPYDVGDIDGDSLTDLIGKNIYDMPDTLYNIVPTQESPYYTSYPEFLSWYYRFSHTNFAWSSPVYFTCDLDNDWKKEIICRYYGDTYIFENIANNQNVLVWNYSIPSWSFAFGDFDLDGNKEFVTTNLGAVISVYENTGDDQYEIVYRDTVNLPNSIDVFSSNDLDQDGKPEFFVVFAYATSDIFFLYMWEATGNNTFERTLIDQKQISVSTTVGRQSKCGDLDGDGIDELVWATPTMLYIYKATGNNQFQQVWQWSQNHGTHECLIVNVYDMNRNGYNEIVIGGSGKTSIFEVEAVRLLYPNGGETFQDSSQQLITWQKFYPPRCDSLSLFYSIDNGYDYTMITHGLSGNDTSYLWTVPNTNSDSCKVKIIAYGPGWQYDESDGVFSITSTGIEENTTPNTLRLTLKVYPNVIRNGLAYASPTLRVTLPVEEKITINLFDISGRLVKTLVDDDKNPGNYNINLNTQTMSSGVYFICLGIGDKRIFERLLIIK